MKYKFVGLVAITLLLAGPAGISLAQTQKDEVQKTTPTAKVLTLVDAAMCEDIKDYAPHFEAIIFSSTIGKLRCFTSFDPVPVKTFIIHRWFREDKLSSQKKLTLKPPRWSTFSSIQLREADKGPWRVEITGPEGKIFKILRFSILD